MDSTSSSLSWGSAGAATVRESTKATVRRLRHALVRRIEAMHICDAAERSALMVDLDALRGVLARYASCTVDSSRRDGDAHNSLRIHDIRGRLLVGARPTEAETTAFARIVLAPASARGLPAHATDSHVREQEQRLLVPGSPPPDDSMAAGLCLFVSGGIDHRDAKDAAAAYRAASEPRRMPAPSSALTLARLLAALTFHMTQHVQVARARDGALVLDCVRLALRMAPVTPSALSRPTPCGGCVEDNVHKWYVHGRATREWLLQPFLMGDGDPLVYAAVLAAMRWVTRFPSSAHAADLVEGPLALLLAQACIDDALPQTTVRVRRFHMASLLVLYVECAALVWPRLALASALNGVARVRAYQVEHMRAEMATPSAMRKGAALRVLLAAAPAVLLRDGACGVHDARRAVAAACARHAGSRTHPLLYLLQVEAYRHLRGFDHVTMSVPFMTVAAFDVLFPAMLRPGDICADAKHAKRVRLTYMTLALADRTAMRAADRAHLRGLVMRELARRDFDLFTHWLTETHADGTLRNVGPAQALLDPGVASVVQARMTDAIHLCLAVWHVGAPEAMRDVLPPRLLRAHRAAQARAKRRGAEPCDGLARVVSLPLALHTILCFLGTHDDLWVVRATRHALQPSRAICSAARAADGAARAASYAAVRVSALA